MPLKRKQTSAALLDHIEDIPHEIVKLLNQGTSLAIKKKEIESYIGGLIRQIGTRVRSKDPKEKYPPRKSGFLHWDHAYIQIRRKELETIQTVKSYQNLLGL